MKILPKYAAAAAVFILIASGFGAASAQSPAEMIDKDGANMMEQHISADAEAAQVWAGILSRYTAHDGALVTFDYEGLHNNEADMVALAGYISDLAAQNPSAMHADAAIAYWANLYNALTVQIVAQNYPVGSIRDIKSGLFSIGPWKKKLVTVEGQDLTLDNIEHDIMRPQFQTPMVHYMVNCASIGCPNLMTRPWTADTLKADQDAAAKAFINAPRGVSLDGGRVKVSSIYKWFKEDFGSTEAGVLAHLTAYADPELKAALLARGKIDKYDYNWKLNAPKGE